MVGDEPAGVELLTRDEAQQRRGRVRVDESGRDRHVAAPEFLEVQRGRLAGDTDVGDAATGPGEADGLLEGGRYADRFDAHVRPEAAGELGDGGLDIFA